MQARSKLGVERLPFPLAEINSGVCMLCGMAGPVVVLGFAGCGRFRFGLELLPYQGRALVRLWGYVRSRILDGLFIGRAHWRLIGRKDKVWPVRDDLWKGSGALHTPGEGANAVVATEVGESGESPCY
jgi:hypothetical protein